MVASMSSRFGWIAVFALIIAANPSATARAGAPAEGAGGAFHATNAIGAIDAIDAAVASGELTEAEGLLNKVRFVTRSGALPKRFESAGTDRIKCGTGVLLEAMAKISVLPGDIREEILTLIARPATATYVDTPHFRVHYDTSGPNMIYGWPGTAYRDSVVAACETSWSFYHVANNWQIPPSDGSGGGNSLIDCYVTDAGAAYGWTQPDLAAPRWPDDWTAFFVIDHAYDPPFGYADRTLPMKITVAHEYHHVVQMGYTLANNWWMENVATFMEDEVYDAIDDNHAYILGYMNFPHQRLSTYNSSHEYACFLWPTLIKEKWTHDVVRQVYHCTASGASIYTCLDNVFAQFGTDFALTLAEWGIWNFYTSIRNDGHHYGESQAYEPIMAYDQQFSTYPQMAKHPSTAKKPEGTGQSVMRFVRNTSSSDRKLTITFDGPSCTAQVAMVVKEAGQLVFHEYYMTLNAAGNGTLDISNWNNMEYGHLLVQMSNGCPGAQDYVFDAVTTAPTAVEAPPLYTRTVRLDQNEPNPFGPETRIRYTLDRDAPVHMAVFDAGGRQVRVLVQASQGTGEYQVRWDGLDDAANRVTAGVYFYRLQVGSQSEVRKMVIME
jgi:hypothetical protein